MLFSIATLSLLLSAASASPAVTNPIARSADASDVLPFKSTFAFTAHLQLGKPLPTIAVPGGVLIAEPIISGIVCGPTINATIAGGLATPSVYENQTLQVPVIQAYGTTDDGFGFVINELGVGAPKGQITRIQLSIGGGSKYASLRDGYVLATVNPNANQTEVFVQGYIIENDTKFM